MPQNLGVGPAEQFGSYLWLAALIACQAALWDVTQKGTNEIIDQPSQASCMQLPLTGTVSLIIPSTCTGDGPVGGVQSEFCPGVGAGGSQHPCVCRTT